MATIACKYHPKLPARWICADCDIYFCADCVGKDSRRNVAVCPLCKSEVAQVRVANFVEPFWRRLPRFFLYPLNGTSLGLIVFLTMGSLILSFAGIFGIFFQLVLLLGAIQYLMLVLERTSTGDLKPPGASLEVFTQRLELPIKQLLVYILIPISIGVVGRYLGGFAALVWMVFVLLVLPASVMSLAIDHSFFRAINPVLLSQVIYKIGWPYMLLYLFLLLVSAGNQALTSALSDSGSLVLMLIQSAVGMYFAIIMYNLMGYIIFQYHDELGYDIDLDIDRPLEAHTKALRTSAGGSGGSEVDVLIKEGRLEDAADTLESRVRAPGAGIADYERLHGVLKASGQAQKLLKYGMEYVNMLLAQDKTSRAAAVYKDCVIADANVKPSNPDRWLALAETLANGGNHKEAVLLLKDFHVRHPQHPDVAAAYLLMSRLLFENLGRAEQARKVVAFLKAKYATHSVAADVERYESFMKKVGSV